MAEPQQQPPLPQEQQYQAYAQYTYPDPQQPQPYDQNQQQAAVPYDPSYEAHYAAYYQQQQQYYDPNAYSHHHQQQQQQYHNFSQVYPHHQPDPTQVHPPQFDPASYHHYPPPHPPELVGKKRKLLHKENLTKFQKANSSGRGGGPPFRAHGNRGGRHGRGRGRGGGRNPNRFGPAMPPPPKLPVVKIWCDICRVECSRMDILEQHKNGKRHKKTAQKLEEMQKQQKMFAGYQASVMPGTMQPIEYQASAVPSAVYHQPANVMLGALHTTGYQQENLNFSAVPSSSVTYSAPEVAEQKSASSAPNSIATAEPSSAQAVDPAKAFEVAANIVQVDDACKPHNAQKGQNSEANVATTEAAADLPSHNNSNQADARRGSVKRKPTKYGRGGKKQKKFDPRYVPERPRVCTLCNVTCETQTGFDTHTAGKKHNSRLKRLQHHGAVFGPITVYIPPNQPTPYPIRGPEPLYYGLNSCNMVNQVAFSVEGVHMGNLESHDTPLVFVPKESNGLETNVDVEVTNLDDTDSKENNNEEIGNVVEEAAFDSKLEISGNAEMNDTLDGTKDLELKDNAGSQS